jgi:hypothetical protein
MLTGVVGLVEVEDLEEEVESLLEFDAFEVEDDRLTQK